MRAKTKIAVYARSRGQKDPKSFEKQIQICRTAVTTVGWTLLANISKCKKQLPLPYVREVGAQHAPQT